MLSQDLATVGLVVLVVLSLSLAVPVDAGGGADPVAFGDTLRLGLTGETVREAEQHDLSIPRVQVYYSGYEYVVGFNGVESFVAEQARTGNERQFGRPVAVFVSDYAGTNVSLTEDGYLTATRHVGFERAGETYVVVDSRARLPSGPVAVPFGERDAAADFADEYGGSVVPWRDVGDRVDADRSLDASTFRAAVDNRSEWADDAVASTSDLADRPTSVVVGEDEPTLEAALEAAPPNTTVEVPPGTYRTDGLVVNESVTVAGTGPETRIVGDENGTVVHAAASRVALTDLTVAGVGDVGSRRGEMNASQLSDVGWSENVELAYGRGDAGVRLVDAPGSLVSDVRVESPSSGVVVLNSSGSALRGLDVNVTRGMEEGYMGVVAMYDPIVVEDSSFEGGRDGVYTHRADGVVVRENEFADVRFGVHQMYTSESLVRANAVRDARTGVVVMTRPTGNLVVDNDVRESGVGISTAGSHSYFAGNVLADNARGLDVLSAQSLYTHNTVVDNGVGIRGGTGLATNLVTANDVVDNDRAATAELGSLRVWTVGDEGNYWGPVPGFDEDGDGHSERAFRPTGPVDSRVDTVPGAWTLAQSPSVEVVRRVESTVPGLRAAGVVDTAPRARPARPEALAAVRDGANSTEVGA
ncbi:NosD domain-containing protein [Halobacterium yunchengense]|uniref:NosD domain-containing protein n=1 Tax=Halobacterium yunchengense TaxID=3108497 RepID=UPI00300A606C